MTPGESFCPGLERLQGSPSVLGWKKSGGVILCWLNESRGVLLSWDGTTPGESFSAGETTPGASICPGMEPPQWSYSVLG